MSSSKDSHHTRIEPLTEENFGSWFVNIRAELRSRKLWTYTQTVYTSDEASTEEQVSKKEQKLIKDWEEKCQEAADLMIPTISPRVQQKLTELEFNDGYLMLTRLRVLLQPTGSSEFMRLSKEYYTIQFKLFKSIPEYLTHIKILEERIDNTKIVLNEDNRTILCLSMSLSQEYQYLVQIWAVTSGITAEKARQMVLEASRQHTQAAIQNSQKALRVEQKCPCGGKHSSEKCWVEHPKIAPEWFKLKMKEQAKGKGKPAEQAQRFQAKLATEDNLREEDFHISV